MSGESEKDAALSRTTDGVPVWNGEAGSFSAYEEAAMLWESGIEYRKRYTAAPRLMAELTGAAKRLVAGKPAEEVACAGGVRQVLDYLRKSLGKPKVNEVTDLLGKYFKGTRRRTGESMNDYVTRKSEAFLRVSQALRRVQPHYRKAKMETYGGNNYMTPYRWSRRSSDASGFWGSGGWGRQTTTPEEGDDHTGEGRADDEVPEEEDSGTTTSWGWGSTYGSSWGSQWQGPDWYGSSWYQGTWPSYGWSSTSASEGTSTWESLDQLEDNSLLPGFIQGWYLLMDAALDSNERNLVMTALRGDFSPARVAQELRNQFPEGELRKRDTSRRSHAFVSIAEEEPNYDEDYEWGDEAYGGWDDCPEEAALIVEAESEAQEAFAAYQQARRTLKDARMRQHCNKMNRQYYRGSSSASSGTSRPSSTFGQRASGDEHMECLRCGRKGHRAANCPEKPLAAQATAEPTSTTATEQVSFVFFAESEQPSESALAALPTTAQAVDAGMAVVDGGATKTIGSVAAIEALLKKNVQKYGETRLRALDTEDQPVFGFGNSTENRCLSTCQVGVTASGLPGSMQIHSLESGNGPILLSVDALRSLGAVVDFEHDLMVLTKLDRTKIIPLHRSATGHQLLSLTEDLFSNALVSAIPGCCRSTPLAYLHMPDLIAAFPAQVLLFVRPSVYLPRHIMDRLTRDELTLHLRSLGETAPEGWTRMEIRQRITEIAEANPSLAATPSSKTDLEAMMVKLNRVSRKKSELQKFCLDELRIKYNDNDTIAQLQKKATAVILDITEPQAGDFLGFGKYSDKTYSEVYHLDSQYCQWVSTTAREGDCCARLARFDKWLLKTRQADAPAVPLVNRPKAKSGKNVPKISTPEDIGGYTSVATTSAQGSTPLAADPRDALMLQMADTLKNLQEEVSQMREDEPDAGDGGQCQMSSVAELQYEMNLHVSVVKGCSVGLKERSKPPPRAQATLEPLPPKFCTISADVGHWEHPHNKEPVQFMLIIDEGSRYRVARVLSRGSKQQPTANACIQYLQEGWHQYFGHPRAVRVDAAGAFRSFALIDQYCDKHGVYLDIIPGEAHWKNGVCEQAIQGVKEVMTRLCQYDADLTTEAALAEAVRVFNHRDMIRGFSPAQHVIGRGTDDTDRFVEAGEGLPPGLLVEHPTGEFARAAQRRAEAEKLHADWNANQQIKRAQNSRHRPCYNYLPGELVFFWRSQESGRGRRQPGTRQGRFLGPARILATETRKSTNGELAPGGAVWLVRGRALIKCAPEQLRRATEREEILEGLSAQNGQATPWTFTQVASSIGGNQFQDATSDVPNLEEWRAAQDPTEAAQPSRLRVRGKRSAQQLADTDQVGDLQMDADENKEAPIRRPRQDGSSLQAEARGECWWTTVPEDAWPTQENDLWKDPLTAVQVEVPLPDTNRGVQKLVRNFEGYFVGHMKRKAVEVSERRLTPAELQEFRAAKQVEVKNFLSADAFQALPAHLQPSKEQAVGMRWVLTWKLKDDGTRKAKARAVLLGYQDPCYEHRSTTAMGISENSVTRIKRACYGLVDAPLEWYRTVDTFLRSIGLERSSSDSCVWCYRRDGILKGLISGHVDDFIFGGDEDDAGWRDVLDQIQKQFKWGDWEVDKFTQCGVLIETTERGFELSQPSYLEGLSEISVNATRRKDRSAGTTDRERTLLRALLGGLSWHAQQVAPHLSADVSLLLSEVGRSTVDTIIRANMLLSHTKARKEHKLIIHKHAPDAELVLVAWVDAAAQSRVDGGSTQGIVIGIAPQQLLQGEVCDISLMSWHSSKIDRCCRSPGASEALAAINGEDNLYYARYQWSELLYGNQDIRKPDITVTRTPGCLVTDSRNVYDKMSQEVIVVKGAEKRTSIELLGLKEAQRRTNVIIRWVHSEAQLANSLTKANGLKELEMFYRMSQKWRIVEDENMMSARRRRELGLRPLSQSEGVENSLMDEKPS
ncbi:RE1 [Symbiodinium sp. CCMP2592]|nr:RE1 [Symbiodinium sp. CCMP2592]